MNFEHFLINNLFFLLQTQHVVWVSCEGENPADVENIGTISYYPLQGFPAYYFPFKNIEGYLPPLVAVHFSGPKSKYHQFNLKPS